MILYRPLNGGGYYSSGKEIVLLKIEEEKEEDRVCTRIWPRKEVVAYPLFFFAKLYVPSFFFFSLLF